MAVQNYYFAFISYSRKDEKHAKWLHSQFEHYNLLVQVMNLREDLPDTFMPIFRAEDELTGDNLKPQISAALASSEFIL